jgi:hypothetical protein
MLELDLRIGLAYALNPWIDWSPCRPTADEVQSSDRFYNLKFLAAILGLWQQLKPES